MSMKTSEAVKALDISFYQLTYLIRSGKVPAPRKDGSGDYCWNDDDLARARQALAARRRSPLTTVAGCRIEAAGG